jgi:hypothetical protein
MSSKFSVKVDFDGETEKRVSTLSAQYKLGTFVKLAVEAYLDSPEGKRIFYALCGRTEKKRRKGRGESGREEQRISAPKAHEGLQIATPSVFQASAAKSRPVITVIDEPDNESRLQSTQDVLSKMLKRNRE